MKIDIEHDGFVLSTDKTRLEVDTIHRWLSEESYWAIGRTRKTVETSIEHSICVGIYSQANSAQAAFARVVTDLSTFAWLADVVVFEPYRKRGLSKWLVQTLITQPELTSLRLFVLGTRDAHELYRRYGGFLPLQYPERWMTRFRDEAAAP